MPGGGSMLHAIQQMNANRKLKNRSRERNLQRKGSNKSSYNIKETFVPKLSPAELKALEEKCKRDLARRKFMEKGMPVFLFLVFTISISWIISVLFF